MWLTCPLETGPGEKKLVADIARDTAILRRERWVVNHKRVELRLHGGQDRWQGLRILTVLDKYARECQR